MTGKALVQARIDPDVKSRAAEVLDGLGMTVSDAVRILLTRTAREGALPFDVRGDAADHDAWFREQVLASLSDARPPVSHQDAEVRFAARRAAARRRATRGAP